MGESPLLRLDISKKLKRDRFYLVVRSFLLANNPFTQKGRSQLKRTLLSSGPAAWRYANPNPSKIPAKYSGWRMGSLMSIYVVGICLLINLFFMIFAATVAHTFGGIGTLFTGNCDEVKTLDRWLHFIINMLGSILMGTSNYNMQFLSSPTRKEVDGAHERGTWLDIGVPSVRNLRLIRRRRVTLWWILAVSTLPLHLLWNSAIFSTFQANDFIVIVVSHDFLFTSGPTCSNRQLLEDSSYADVVCDMYQAGTERMHQRVRKQFAESMV